MTALAVPAEDDLATADPTEGRIASMAAEKRKVSITLDIEVIERAQEDMDERGFSAYINDVVRYEQKREGMRQFLSMLDEKFGPVPEEILEEARQEWQRLQAEIHAEIASSSTAEH